jgi:uncharacterized protein DUF4232
MSAHVPALPLEADPLIAEAKQRARRRRLLAGTALLAAGAVVGGVLAFGAGGGSGVVPWLPTRPQLGPANPPLAPACTAAQLRATLSLQGATGNLAGGITIVNRSSQPCALVGRPKLSFAGATSKWRETASRAPTNTPFDPLAPSPGSLRALAPGRHVFVGLWWSNWCGRGSADNGNSGRGPTGIVLAAPGGGRIVLRENRLHPGRLGAPPCYASPSTLSATRFTPFVPQGPPSSQLPLKVRIVSGPRFVIKGESISDPSLVAGAGGRLSYTVVLTNRSRRTFTFGRTCPAYTEGIGGAQNQAYILNCHAVGSIGPGRSVRFAMRVRVPQRLRDPFPPLGWTLAPHSWNAPQALAIVRVD